MSMSMPEFDPSLANASVDDPTCVKAGDTCRAFYDAHQLSQKEVSYYHQFDYGHYVSWFCLALLGVFVFGHGYRVWQERRNIKASSRMLVGGLYCKVQAMVRYITYRRIPGSLSDRLGMPTAGIGILIILFTLYCLVLSFAVRPYYRQHRGYGSPPLAIRTGLMAIALTPWIIALSGKFNLVTMLTGIGYEKLNVFHRWIGRICLGLSVVHTIPFLVAPLRDGGYAALHKQFYEPGGFEYTGVPPLAMLFGIVVLSVPWIRHRAYETFYYSHFLLGVAYVGLMFWHAGLEGDSWTYLWITIATWLLSIVVRSFWYQRAINIRQPNWLQGYTAQISLLPGDVTKIEVLLPEDLRTRPAQHFYLRFPEVSVLDSHPFTMAWKDVKKDAATEAPAASTLSFFIRSRDGFTKRLRSTTERKSFDTTSVWLDGPYGGINVRMENLYDHIILIAGGIGITACLPWMQHIVNHKASGNKTVRLSSIKLVWAVRHVSHIEWVDEYLQLLSQSTVPEGFLTIEIHCTSENTRKAAGNDAALIVSPALDLEKGGSMSDSSDVQTRIEPPTSQSQLVPGRPRMDSVLEGLEAGSTAVIGCGPTSLKVDLSNACAKAQTRVVRGELEELALYTETFGW